MLGSLSEELKATRQKVKYSENVFMIMYSSGVILFIKSF